MIEVFEIWFNQFSKAEKERLLKHIIKNHALASNDYVNSYPEKIDKKKSEPSSIASSRSLHNVKSEVES